MINRIELNCHQCDGYVNLLDLRAGLAASHWCTNPRDERRKNIETFASATPGCKDILCRSKAKLAILPIIG